MERFAANQLLAKLQERYVPPENKPRRIIDLRNKEKFFLDDVYLNGYAKHCGAKATLVYISLCRHANSSQVCWPSQDFISKEHSISRKTVYSAIKILQKWNIIDVFLQRSQGGKFLVTTYTLLDKSVWEPIEGKKTRKGSHG